MHDQIEQADGGTRARGQRVRLIGRCWQMYRLVVALTDALVRIRAWRLHSMASAACHLALADVSSSSVSRYPKFCHCIQSKSARRCPALRMGTLVLFDVDGTLTVPRAVCHLPDHSCSANAMCTRVAAL